MIPVKIEDVFIQFTTTTHGVIVKHIAGKFIHKQIKKDISVYKICPFLEGTLEALELEEPFLLESMVVAYKGEEFNVDVNLFKTEHQVEVLIHDRTNVYKIVEQLNQNRNDIFFIKRELAEKNKELKKLRDLADKANEEKSRFLAMMSHEVRNPLHAILGYADLIEKEVTSTNAKSYINSLNIAGTNLKVIVDDILDMSRIEAGKLTIAAEEVDIKEIVKNGIQIFKDQQKESQVVLKTDIDTSIPNSLLGDRVRLHQVLSNLVTNAIKFTKQGAINISLKQIIITDKTSTVELKVADTGRGMSQDQILTIFDEYQQTQLDDNRIYKGAGLGLYIVKRLVDAMHGKIRITSKLNIGTTFTIHIPFVIPKNKSKKAKDKKEKSNFSLKEKHILVADDDILNQTIINHILSKEQAKVTFANDGEEALTLLNTKSFDLVLSDIIMPKISGEELIQLKPNFKKNNQTPFIALTANAGKKEITHYKKIGFKTIILKPFTAEELLEKMAIINSYIF